MSSMVRFIPNQRTKSILVISPQQTYLTRATDPVPSTPRRKAPKAALHLQRPQPRSRGTGRDRGIHVPASSPRNVPQGGRNVAPRYQQAAVQSTATVQSAQAGPKAGLAHRPAYPAHRAAPAQRSAVRTRARNPTQGRTHHLAPSRSSDQERVRVSGGRTQQHPSHSRLAPGLSARAASHPKPRHLAEPGADQATIAEVTLNDDLKFGVRWHWRKKAGCGFTGGGIRLGLPWVLLCPGRR